MTTGKERAVDGKNLTIWFPDAQVSERLTALADELKTSSSAIIFELVCKAMPVIEANKDKHEIPLDGVRVDV